MRIDGWQIEGFGIFRDWEVRGLSPALTVFLGPNEAGKSTLLAFLRGALFGFPRRRGQAPQYPPLLGGRHGGRLILSGPEGEVTVERMVARKDGLRVDGRESTGEDLRALLGGADENVFCSVFAFGLSEMQSFDWLRADQIRERIFSAGIAGAGASARQAIETLEAEAAVLYRTRGGSRVRELLDRMEQAERRSKAAQAEAERYSSLEQEREKWSARAIALAGEEQDLRRKQHSMETLIELWSERERGREELAALEPIDAFPSEPEARLATLAGQMAAARAVVHRLEQEQSARDAQRAKIAAELDDRLAAISDRVEEFHGMLALHRERLKALADARLEPAGRSVAAYARWIGLIFGACIALPAGWLTVRGEVAGGLAALFMGLFAAGIVLYRRVTRQERWAARLARLEQDVAGWEQPVREWSACVIYGERLIPEFLDLRDRCRKDRDMRTRAASLDEATAQARTQFQSAQSDVVSAEAERQAFLRECSAANETQFQSRLRIFWNRQQLAALIQDRETRIAAFEGTLAPGGIDEWRNESNRLQETLGRVQAQRDEAVGEQRLAEAARRQIAESIAVPEIQSELEWLRSELAAAVREWRVSMLAKELVSRTLQEFTRTRQPAVLEEASLAFARVTAGAYQRILQDEQGESLVIVDSAAQRKRPEELSRGAAEQLYLCLRLALAGEFARRTASLPLIMDDVLVNFDPERARAMACELAHFSRQHQVLLFTCHPETAHLFAEAAPETKIIRMERYGESSAKYEVGQ